MVMGTSTLREAPLVSFSYRPKMSVHILSVVFRSVHTQGPYLALLSAGYSLLPSSFHMSMVSFIISNLLIALSLGALGGTLGSKRARKKEADLSRQGGTGCIIARAQTECEASPEKMDERHHSFC